MKNLLWGSNTNIDTVMVSSPQANLHGISLLGRQLSQQVSYFRCVQSADELSGDKGRDSEECAYK